MTNVIVQTPIYLDETQIKQWVMMEFLNSVGAFDVKNGSIHVHFNEKGEIAKVEKHEVYRPPSILK